MGNTPKQQNKQCKHRYIMQLRQRQIIINRKLGQKVTINDLSIFPNDYQGLHLFDSNVILARFMCRNTELVNDKDVIELLSGTGLASIALRKFSSPTKVVATDRYPEVINNQIENCRINNITSGIVSTVLKWSEYENFIDQFDVLIGADLLFPQCPIGLLLRAMSKLLRINGIAYIIVPERKEDQSSLFISLVDQSGFTFSEQILNDPVYMENPLPDEMEETASFSEIAEGRFRIFTLVKISQNQLDKTKIIIEQKTQLEKTNQQSNLDNKELPSNTQNKHQEQQIKIQEQIECKIDKNEEKVCENSDNNSQSKEDKPID